MTRRAALLVILLAAACSAGAAGPVEPVWGKQPCDHCMMLISERAPAAQALLRDGTRKFFDDVGCLVIWLEQNPASLQTAWVRTPGGAGWVDTSKVRYSAGHHTPMDYGFLPAEQGLSFQELPGAIRQRAAQRGTP